MRTRWLAVVIGFAVLRSTAAFGSVVPTPATPAPPPSLAHKISVDGQPVFVHRFPTFNQFQWMKFGSITMTGKAHVTITSLVNDRNVITVPYARSPTVRVSAVRSLNRHDYVAAASLEGPETPQWTERKTPWKNARNSGAFKGFPHAL